MDTETFDDVDFDEDVDDAFDDGADVDDRAENDDTPDDHRDDTSDDPPDEVPFRLPTMSLEDIEARDDGQHDEIYVVKVHTSYYDDNVWHDSYEQVDSVWDDLESAQERADDLSNVDGGDAQVFGRAEVFDSASDYQNDATWSVYRIEPIPGNGYEAPGVAVVLDSIHPSRESAQERYDEIGPVQVSGEYLTDVREWNDEMKRYDEDDRSVWVVSGASVDGNAVLEGQGDSVLNSSVYFSERLPVEHVTLVGDVPDWLELNDDVDRPMFAFHSVLVSELEDLQPAVITVDPIRYGNREE